MMCQYIGIGYPIGGGGGGGGDTVISGGMRDYHFSLDGPVPDSGQRYLQVGSVSSLSAPHVVISDGSLNGASIRVDTVDPLQGYALQFLRNGVVVHTLNLPAGQIKAFTTAFTAALVAGDEISARLVRSSGTGRSAFSYATIVLYVLGA